MAKSNPIELWKAIHGGCWPGPPPDRNLSRVVNEVVAGLALYNLSNTFSDSKVARQIRTVAVGTLNVSIPALQSQLKQ